MDGPEWVLWMIFGSLEREITHTRYDAETTCERPEGVGIQ